MRTGTASGTGKSTNQGRLAQYIAAITGGADLSMVMELPTMFTGSGRSGRYGGGGGGGGGTDAPQRTGSVDDGSISFKSSNVSLTGSSGGVLRVKPNESPATTTRLFGGIATISTKRNGSGGGNSAGGAGGVSTKGAAGTSGGGGSSPSSFSTRASIPTANSATAAASAAAAAFAPTSSTGVSYSAVTTFEHDDGPEPANNNTPPPTETQTASSSRKLQICSVHTNQGQS